MNANEFVDQIQTNFAEIRSRLKFNAIVYGKQGTGKTRLISTARKPILLHCFDPCGWTTSALLPLIERGDLLVEDFSSDSMKKPHAYIDWCKRYDELKAANFFDCVGTYAIDSLTNFGLSMMNAIVRMSSLTKQNNLDVPTQTAYGVQLRTFVDDIKGVMALPCDVIMTGHIALERDEVELTAETMPALAGQQAIHVPNQFMEVWITRVVQIEGKPRYVLQVHADGKYGAKTRIGEGKLEIFEEPDIHKILAKVGWKYEDKPSFGKKILTA